MAGAHDGEHVREGEFGLALAQIEWGGEKQVREFVGNDVVARWQLDVLAVGTAQM